MLERENVYVPLTTRPAHLSALYMQIQPSQEHSAAGSYTTGSILIKTLSHRCEMTCPHHQIRKQRAERGPQAAWPPHHNAPHSLRQTQIQVPAPQLDSLPKPQFPPLHNGAESSASTEGSSVERAQHSTQPSMRTLWLPEPNTAVLCMSST